MARSSSGECTRICEVMRLAASSAVSARRMRSPAGAAQLAHGDADGHARSVAAVLHPHRVLHAMGEAMAGIGAAAGQDRGELVASEPVAGGRAIGGAHGSRDGADALVADRVAEPLVRLLEPVEVEHDEADAALRERAREIVVERAAVAQARERVGDRGLLEVRPAWRRHPRARAGAACAAAGAAAASSRRPDGNAASVNFQARSCARRSAASAVAAAPRSLAPRRCSARREPRAGLPLRARGRPAGRQGERAPLGGERLAGRAHARRSAGARPGARCARVTARRRRGVGRRRRELARADLGRLQRAHVRGRAAAFRRRSRAAPRSRCR